MPLRALEDQSVLDRYLELKAHATQIEEEMEALKPMLLSAVLDEPEGKGYHCGFALGTQNRRSCEYSERVSALERTAQGGEKVRGGPWPRADQVAEDRSRHQGRSIGKGSLA